MSTMNISRGGVFVLGNPSECPDITVGIDVELVIFATSGGAEEEVALKAKVVRSAHADSKGKLAGFGLQFVGLDAAQNRALDQLIKTSNN